VTRSAIVEALRCAADLCGIDAGPLGLACGRLCLPAHEVEDVAILVLGREPAYSPRESYRHDLLEAAQRIEEGQ